MAWTRPKFGRGVVDRAAKTLALHWDDYQDHLHEVFEGMTTVANWRSSHGYPLTVLKRTLLARAESIDSGALVSHRLKRIPSIVRKLQREKTMKLSQMHDIGGCRAIMSSSAKAAALIFKYKESFQREGIQFKEYDYISDPKPDGYRSFHFAVRYRSRSEEKKVYAGLRLEIQIRTQMQHCWAAAVETADLLTGQALKSNIGEEQWKRFFALAASVVADIEGAPPVPNTPSVSNGLLEETSALVRDLNVMGLFGGLGQAVNVLTENATNSDLFLIHIDSKKKEFRARGYGLSAYQVADDDYLLLERENLGNPHINTVLVSVKSIEDLRSAYPSYYMDALVLVALLEEHLKRGGKRL